MYELGHLSQGNCLQDVFAIRIRLTTTLGRLICKAGEALSKPIEVWESVALPCECSGVDPYPAPSQRWVARRQGIR
jgi:hypothetical protein